MDLNEYWEENKRFVSGLAVGVLAFFIAHSIVTSIYAGDLKTKARVINQRKRELGQALHGPADLADAERENEALSAAAGELETATHFVPRERFRIDATRGAASSQYLRALSEVREELLPRANRANLLVDSGLGLPALSPTREVDIERYMEALDVVDSLVNLAIDADVQRVDQIRIALDPGLKSRKGVGAIERTRVSFVLIGSSLALERILTWTQRPPDGRVLHIHELELVPSRSKADEVRLDLVLLIARVAAWDSERESDA